MKKLPYGLSNFPRLISENYYYVDKTRYIELLEEQPSYLFLLRPRRFGKSLFLAMLETYYSIDYRDRFEELFGGLYIGQHPTENRNRYLVLRFNFSEVKASPEEVEHKFAAYCCMVIRNFILKYETLLGEGVWEVVDRNWNDPGLMLSALNQYLSRTECPRIYLLICGSVMTFCLVIFLSRRAGRYLWVVLGAMAAFAAVAYVPAWNPERVALRSQTLRVERIAASLGRLDAATGHLSLVPAQLADTTFRKEYRELYEALVYVERDSAAFARFGIERANELVEILPTVMHDYVQWGWEEATAETISASRTLWINLPQNVCLEIDEDDRYSRCYVNLAEWDPESYTFENDTLRFYLGEERPVLEITGAEVLKKQLEQSGFDPSAGVEPSGEETLRLLDYRDERCRMLFEILQIVPRDSTEVISSVEVHSLWLR